MKCVFVYIKENLISMYWLICDKYSSGIHSSKLKSVNKILFFVARGIRSVIYFPIFELTWMRNWCSQCVKKYLVYYFVQVKSAFSSFPFLYRFVGDIQFIYLFCTSVSIYSILVSNYFYLINLCNLSYFFAYLAIWLTIVIKKKK